MSRYTGPRLKVMRALGGKRRPDAVLTVRF